ncbi:MAG TPA: hypothetical protein VMU30_00995 [Bacteroidota bacterium]|nr:hypothetical protein [Bacteroidota bacterium]
MKSIALQLVIVAAGIFGLTVFCSTPSSAQKQIDATMTFNEYDVMYLADFIDVKSQKISSNISGISLALTNLAGTPKSIYIKVEVDVALQGDNTVYSEPYLVVGKTNVFIVPVMGRILAARDFSNSGSDIYVVNSGYDENSALRKKLEDLASTIPTAPPGNYTIKMQVMDAQTNNDIGGGWITKTISITQSTVDEAIVEITDPQDGSWFNNLAPTFSWTTTAPRVVVNVFEVGISQHSAQDALTGSNPFLSQTVTGATTLTYPPDAPRKLEQGKAYVVQVQGIITTNRGDVNRSSKPVTFRITDDKVGRILEQLLNGIGGAPYASYTTLRSAPSSWVAWPAYGGMTLDGQTVSDADIQTIANALAGRDDVQLSIENQ